MFALADVVGGIFGGDDKGDDPRRTEAKRDALTTTPQMEAQMSPWRQAFDAVGI